MQQGGIILSERGYRAYERLLSTLDFSTTPNGNSRMTMARRSILLLEILNRVELPPDTEIPGDDEVAHGALKQWTIPGTRITIQQIERGPRVGEYLFSATTVERLHRMYLLVKPLPYKREGAFGIYEDFVSSERSGDYTERLVRNRLRPIDASSPRATIDGFLDTVNRAYALVMKANASIEADLPKMTPDEVRETEIIAMNLMKRAIGTLDLSKVPQTIRDDVGIESVLQLKEIFDRMSLPSIDAVPNMEMVIAEKKRVASTASGVAGSYHWRFPNTTIEIVEIMDGERKGHFLFGADTVSRLKNLYKAVQDLPYREDYSKIAREYISPGISQGFYKYYISTPGQLIPQATFGGRLVESLPAWFKAVYGDQTVWQWISLALMLSLGVLFLVMLHGKLWRRSAELSAASLHLRRSFFYLIVAGTVYFLYHVLDQRVNLTGSVLYYIGAILATIKWLSLSIAAFSIGGALAEIIVKSPKIDPDGIQASYIRALFGLLGFLAAAAIFITGLARIGVSLVPLLTGVGIGGLAIALAARPTLENIIGSFMIFLDKPYRVGQRVNVMGQDGTVESIGLRSTKIRLLTGHLTAIPNEKMATVEVENIGRRPHIRRLFNITVTYDTPPEKIKRAVEILREILAVPETPDEETTHFATAKKKVYTSDITKAPPSLAAMIEDIERDYHPNWAINIKDFEPRVSFNEFNADSLNILVIYWFHPPDYWKYLDHATWINTQIVERFNAEGIDFAFPTQTLHLAGDDKHPLTMAQRTVAKDETLQPEAE
jgi:MscS family membrane protein